MYIRRVGTNLPNVIAKKKLNDPICNLYPDLYIVVTFQTVRDTPAGAEIFMNKMTDFSKYSLKEKNRNKLIFPNL